jgi:hypothetical protein
MRDLGLRPSASSRGERRRQGGPHQDRAYPCPSRPGGRRLGLALSGHSASAPATTTGKAPQTYPGHQWDGSGATEPTLSAPQCTGQNPEQGRGRHGPCAHRVYVGHCEAGPCDCLATASRIVPASNVSKSAHARVPQSIGSGAVPVWCTPRGRSEVATTPRASSEAGTRRLQVRW